MAAINASAARTYHGTLVANQNDVLTFGTNIRSFFVRNRDATNPIWVRTDGTAAAVGGAGTFVIMPNMAEQISATNTVESTGTLTVQIISAGAAAYSIST